MLQATGCHDTHLGEQLGLGSMRILTQQQHAVADACQHNSQSHHSCCLQMDMLMTGEHPSCARVQTNHRTELCMKFRNSSSSTHAVAVPCMCVLQPPAEVTARFVAQLMAACQDTDYQVRIAAAEQLPVLARVLGHTATVDQLLPELSELLTDDEVQVGGWVGGSPFWMLA